MSSRADAAPGLAANPETSATRLLRERASAILRHLWPLLAFAAAAVLMTWPLAARIGAQIPADGGTDMLVHQWTFWWLKQSLLSGHNPYFTDLLIYPSGVSLTSQNIAWVNFALWLPLAVAFNSAAATGLSYLIIFTFNAYAMYLFALDQTRSRGGAFVAGLVFGFFPYTLSDAGHVNFLVIGWLPLALLYLDRAIQRGKLRDGVMAGLFLALLAITRWQLLEMGALVGGIFVLFRLIGSRKLFDLATWKSLLVAAGVMLLLIAPLLAPVVYEQMTRKYADELLVYEPAFSADLLGYVIPHGSLTLWSWLVNQLPQNLQFTQQEIGFLGYTVLALAIAGGVLRWRRTAVWLVIAAVLIVLALGPIVTIGGSGAEWVPTPYRLIADTFFNKLIRKPWRYNTLLGLPLAMLAGWGIAALSPKFRPRWTAVLVAACSLLLLAEYWMAPYPLATMTIPAWYQQLADNPDEFGILGIPIGPRLADKYYMNYQTVHGKPLVGGHISRLPREADDYMQGSVFLNDMLTRREMDPAVVDVTHQLRYLADADVRYLVLHKNLSTREQINAWKDWLTFKPVFEDDMTVVYNTRPQAGTDFTLARQLTDSFGVINSRVRPEKLNQGDPFSVDVRFGATAAQPADYNACLRLLATDGSVAQQECTPISPDWTTAHWQAGDVARFNRVMRIDPRLAPGKYKLELSLADAKTSQPVGKAEVIKTLTVEALPRTFTAPTPQHPLDLRFGDSVALHGYDLAQQEGKLTLTLYWQATARIDRSYKVFVHLVDPATGAILAQSDAAPRNWTYPTTWWEPGEYVADTIELPLETAPPAGATLKLGMYDELTTQRLPVAGASQPPADEYTISLP